MYLAGSISFLNNTLFWEINNKANNLIWYTFSINIMCNVIVERNGYIFWIVTNLRLLKIKFFKPYNFFSIVYWVF
jgi:hypothetical protein